MRIVSFDIGIRNLAFCVIEGGCVDDDNIPVKEGYNLECSIINWGIINLCETHEKVKTGKNDVCS